MAIPAQGSKMNWSTINDLYSKLNTARQKFGFATKAVVPSAAGNRAQNSNITTLASFISEMKSNGFVGSTANITTNPGVGTKITFSNSLKPLEEKIDQIQNICKFGDSSFGNSSFGNTGFGNSSFGNTGFSFGNSSFGNSSFGDTGFSFGNSSFGNTGFGDTGFGNSSFGNSSFGDTGFSNSSFSNSSFGDTGFGNSGFGNSSFSNSSFGDTGFSFCTSWSFFVFNFVNEDANAGLYSVP